MQYGAVISLGSLNSKKFVRGGYKFAYCYVISIQWYSTIFYGDLTLYVASR
jgi:hypothetical protein